MRRFIWCLAALHCACSFLPAQKSDSPPNNEVIVVTGYFEPIPLEEADRAIRSIDIRNAEIVSNSFADFLRLDSSLDLRQRAPGGLQVWMEPFTALRMPKLFDLRADPYERADITSNTYNDWVISHGYVLAASAVIVSQYLLTYKEFPPSQRPASFSIA